MGREDILFQKGIKAFNKRNFYDAHEYWEELWLDYKLEDSKFIQGLIQLAVSYYHLFNNNLNGAKSMIKKCLGKFEGNEIVREIDVGVLKGQIEQVHEYFNSINKYSDITDTYILTLNVIHDQ